MPRLSRRLCGTPRTMARRRRPPAALTAQWPNRDGSPKRATTSSTERRGVHEFHAQDCKRKRGSGVKLEVEIASQPGSSRNKPRQIELTRAAERYECRIDGRLVEADICEISDGIYSILIGGRSLEVHVEARGPALRITSAAIAKVQAQSSPKAASE